VGGRIVQSREPTPASMLDQLVRYRATHAAMVPALIQAIVDAPEAQQADFSALRHVVYGASPITPALLSRAVSVLGAKFNQSYGLTESTGVGTLLRPEDHLGRDTGRLRSAGRPLPGMEVAVVDALTGDPLPTGVVGEIALRGPALTPGYWNRPADTDAAMLPAGWLRTGDAGSLDADGYLFLRDRIKDMIITGGENVYPAEVEALLAGHPGIAEVAVIGVPSAKWGETPVAVVVPRAGAAPEPAELIGWARERIAHYKCPTAVVLAEALPRNASGKVLKRVLREPYWQGQERAVG
jgi:long-chain acyl-CoA synthetase